MRFTVLALSAGLSAWLLAGCSDNGHDHSSHDHGPAPAAVTPYPLDTCVVSGEKLGAMGEPRRFVHEGREIKLCCPGCEKDFRKDPGRYLKAIADSK